MSSDAYCLAPWLTAVLFRRQERRHADCANSAGSLEDSASRLSSSTEPFSQSTASSPEPAAPAAEAEPWRVPSEPSPASVQPAALGDGAEGRYQPTGERPAEREPADAELGDERVHGHPCGRERELGHGHSGWRSPVRAQGYDSSGGPYQYAAADPEAEPYRTHGSSGGQYERPASVTDYGSELAHREELTPPPPPPPKTSLQRFLEYLLRGLEKRDTQRFFRAPVTDLQAPGYSSVIRHPMDFSTMRQKVLDNMYSTVAEFQVRETTLNQERMPLRAVLRTGFSSE